MTTLFEARALGRIFANGTVALDGADIAIERGDFATLVGPSGCGKSTLLRLVAGLATRIMEAGHRLDIARVFAGLVLLSVTGIVIYLTLNFLSRRLLHHWHESANAGPD